MKFEIDSVFAAIQRAEASFEHVRELGDVVALMLANGGQPELQQRLMALRAENDAARERRHAKLTHAANG